MKKNYICRLIICSMLVFSVISIPVAAHITPETSVPSQIIVSPPSTPHATSTINKTLNLCVLLTATYRNSYFSPLTLAAGDAAQIDIPFYSTFSIAFNESIVYIDNLPVDYCSLIPLMPCSDTICGTPCSNDIFSVIHHKNAIKNLNSLRYYISDPNQDIFLTLTSTPLCGLWNDSVTGLPTHATNPLGVTYNRDNYTFLTNLPYHTDIQRVRIMQHEISHMFGCHDGVCAIGEMCVMKGDFDNVALYAANIWCSNCRQDFDSNAH